MIKIFLILLMTLVFPNESIEKVMKKFETGEPKIVEYHLNGLILQRDIFSKKCEYKDYPPCQETYLKDKFIYSNGILINHIQYSVQHINKLVEHFYSDLGILVKTIYYFNDGQTQSEVMEYENGKLMKYQYFGNGQSPEGVEEYNLGIRNGLSIRYNYNGELIKKETYKDGKLIETKEY